jgi:hypothetical protein
MVKNLNLIVDQIYSIPSIANMWQVYMRPSCASDFFVNFDFEIDICDP